MGEAIELPSFFAGLWGRFGGNPRNCYRWLVERVAPDLGDALDVLEKCSPFVVASTGRTGTKWLAQLLNQAAGAYVVHEPVPEESYYHARAFAHPEEAEPYLANFRLREMAYRVRARRPSAYGEVNGLLRRHLQPLRQLLPQVRTIQLVRDGRDFVTSVMNRQTYTPQDPIYGSFEPPVDLLATAEWRLMDRFSRICWIWAEENAHIRKHTDTLARFEDITSCYDRFREQILEPLTLRLDETVWANHMKTPVNATQVKRHSGYESWNSDQKDTFWRRCGAAMAEYGYFR